MRAMAGVLAGSALVAMGSCGFTVPLPGDPADGPDRPAVVADGPLGVPVPASPSQPTGERDETTAAAASSPASGRQPALETFTGSASYYADRFEGRRTASGVRFRQSEMWAAHRTLPFGTRLRVTNLENGKEVEVEVVDRGPFVRGRVIDLSKAAARRLGYIRAGHTAVKIEVLERP